MVVARCRPVGPRTTAAFAVFRVSVRNREVSPLSWFAIQPTVCHGRDCSREFDGVNGFRNMCLESCREDSNPIFGARVARQRDRGEKPSAFRFMLPNLSDQLVPVGIREADID